MCCVKLPAPSRPGRAQGGLEVAQKLPSALALAWGVERPRLAKAPQDVQAVSGVDNGGRRRGNSARAARASSSVAGRLASLVRVRVANVDVSPDAPYRPRSSAAVPRVRGRSSCDGSCCKLMHM